MIIPHFGKSLAIYSDNLKFPRNALHQVLFNLTQWFYRRLRNAKSLQRDGQSDDRHHVFRKVHLNPVQVSQKSKPRNCLQYILCVLSLLLHWILSSDITLIHSTNAREGNICLEFRLKLIE